MSGLPNSRHVSNTGLTLSIVIPSYRRPEYLHHCLSSLQASSELIKEVCVVSRIDDTDTLKVLEGWRIATLSVRCVVVKSPGQVAALNEGLASALGDVIFFLDDDTAVPKETVRHVMHQFADPRVDGFGVRDQITGDDFLAGQARIPEVGKVHWYGRTVGNHHRGMGSMREVDVLKGACMAFRRSAIKGLTFDARLRGAGAEIHNDMNFSLAVRRNGGLLFYDPNFHIEHHLAPRMDRDQRRSFNPEAYSDIVHNHTLTLLAHLNLPGKIAYLFWGFVIGTRGEFGLAQVVRHLPAQGFLAVRRCLAAFHGRWKGILTYLKFHPVYGSTLVPTSANPQSALTAEDSTPA